MQRKKFLALMLTAALVGQPGASISVMAAETETEGIEDFGSAASESGEVSLPVITEDLPEETIVYHLNEEAKPLKIRAEESDQLKYLWLKSDDNENFAPIKKADDQTNDKTADDQKQQEEKEQTESSPEYTPATDTPGTFYYKLRIWNQDETDEDAYTESRIVCVEVLDEKQDGNNTVEPDKTENGQSGNNSPDKEDPAETDHDGSDDSTSEDHTGDSREDGEKSEDSTGEDGTDTGDTADTDDTDPDGTADADKTESDGSDMNADSTGADTEDGSDVNADRTEPGTDNTATDADATQKNDRINHLPRRVDDVPETETYETEGYWNVQLSEIFQDPDGDELTYYEKGERDEDWTEIDGNSYLCHLKDNEETYVFTAKDQEGYGDIYAVTLKPKTESLEKSPEDKKNTKKSTDSQEEIFSAGEASAASTQNASFAAAYKATGEHLASMAEKNAPENATLCGEWMVIGLVRSGQAVDSSVYSRYLSNVVDNVKAKKGVLHDRKYSEYSRTILGLTAIGEDVTDVGGYNLLKPLSDFDQTIWQGVNGSMWALIALDSHDYEIPKAAAGKNQTTREKLINDILSHEVSGGGWNIVGSGADSDMTGMGLQALAPYYKSNSKVKAAVDRAVKKLSTMQLADGTFGTMGHSTSESCSQVVGGLSALGIDCDKDSRFIKNGKSLLQGLLSYYNGEGGFLHVMGNGYDQMATEQAYYAMTGYSRMKNGKTSLYDMTDIAIKSDKEKAAEVTKLIEALPSKVTMNNFQQVITAYAAYNGLNSAQKSVITKSNKEKLLNAYKEAQEVEVKYVEGLISKIGNVTLASEDKITDAKIAYNSLSSAQKKKVSNYSVLTAAEKTLQQLKRGTSPTPTTKPSGKPGSKVNMVTPKPTSAPSPTTAANPSKTKSAGGSTKSASVGGKSSKSSSKSGSTKSGSKKSASNTKKKTTDSGKTGSKSSASEGKATQTKASKKVVNEMKVFFDKNRKNPYPEKVSDYSDKQIKELGKTWKNYEKLSEGEKKAVQEDKNYKSFQKLLTSLGEQYHFDQATGTNLDDNKEESLPWYVKMVVNPKIADDSEIETIQKVLGKKSEVLSLNEIHFVDSLTGDNWEPKDILKVQLPMADLGDYKSSMIVHITDKGKVEFLKGKVSGDYITFDAAEFSAYGIVGFMGDSDEILSGQEKSKPVWPWIAAGGAALILVVILGGVQLAGARRSKSASVKKKDKSEK